MVVMSFNVKFGMVGGALTRRQSGMTWDAMGYPGEGGNRRHRAESEKANATAEGGGATWVSLKSAPISTPARAKPARFGDPGWDHLGCCGMGREGVRDRRNRRHRAKSPERVFAILVFLIAGMGFAQQPVTSVSSAPEGIPRELARFRAQQLKDIRYQLSYKITPKAASIEGHEELRFVQNSDDRGILPEWLDFRDGAIGKLTINGQSAPTTIQNGHVELPGKLLKLGENVVEIDFTANVAPAGKAITRFEDKDDGSEYIYTLFVPMDADMAFPCFDQPDLKAKFRLAVTIALNSTAQDWTVLSNTAGKVMMEEYAGGNGIRRIEFDETQPISTYLFAFAAGPFKKVHDVAGMPGLYVRKSKFEKAQAEAPEVQQITADGIKYLSSYFAQPFPFPKYDMVMIPGFAYGGMEHAGATFLREESILFRTAPTHSDRLNRDILLLHELTHQWFGDLVTMRWFDDLWLKEGFAQYMAYHALNALKPNENVWKRFYQAIKPAAYAIDSTKGTTPIYQEIPNLKDAKSAYGAIVYSKAPGVMKQLNFVIGEQAFRDGLRLYLKEHAYANAEWSDLVHDFEQTSKKPLGEWADAWIKRRGMPQVDVEWSCDKQSKEVSVLVRQHDVLGEGGIWPISMLVRMGGATPDRGTMKVELRGPETKTVGIVDHKWAAGCPQWVFANGEDEAYGRFLLDEQSRKLVIKSLETAYSHPVFERTLLWGSLWDSVRQAEMDPREYIHLALRALPDEEDESLAQSIIGRTITALHRYVSPEVRAQLVPAMEALAYDEMMNTGGLHAQPVDMRIIWFRALRGVAETEKARGELKEMLGGKQGVPGVELRPLDRWNIVATLIALNDPDAETVLAAEEKRDPSGDGKKYAYMARAAQPKAEVKNIYFDEYLHDTSRPEDWVELSLGSFNWWNQSELTFPYLKQALDALPQVKRERKIFFLLGWLNAFIGGQQSEAADKQVHEFLDTAALDKDLRLKILEVVDELDRTVKIRTRYK
jgi:aminopeptidase N